MEEKRGCMEEKRGKRGREGGKGLEMGSFLRP